MIRQKVYQLEQAQIKIKQELVPFPPLKLGKPSLTSHFLFLIATKLKFECCDTNLSRAACKPSLPTSADPLQLTQLLPRLLHLPWATAPAICLAVS
jgi:hypothetical protein